MTEYEALTKDLRIDLYHHDLTQEQLDMLRANLTQRVIEAIGKADLRGLQNLARCADAMQHASGCVTPAEQFIENLVRNHYTGGLTTANVAVELEDFQNGYDHMKLIVARYEQIYGDPK